MQATLRRTGTTAVIHRLDDVNPAMPLRKSLAEASPDCRTQDLEPEALTAALSLGAMVLTLLTSLAVKLLLG